MKSDLEISAIIAAGLYASMNEDWFDNDQSTVHRAVQITIALKKEWAKVAELGEDCYLDPPKPQQKDVIDMEEAAEVIIRDDLYL